MQEVVEMHQDLHDGSSKYAIRATDPDVLPLITRANEMAVRTTASINPAA